MPRKPTVDSLLFIPDDILAAFGDEATLQVAESWLHRPVRVDEGDVGESGALARVATRSLQDRVLAFAACLALVGWSVCTGLWTWLAMDTGETVWTAFAGAGAVALLLGVVAVLRFRHVRSRTARPPLPRVR